MYVFQSGLFAPIFYLEDKIAKPRKIPLEGILGEFWVFSMCEVRPIMCFYFRNFHVFSCFLGSHYDFEIYVFNLNGYFSFTTTT
jgi:hypothetical protein